MTQSPFGSTSPSTSPTSPARSRGSVQDQPIENAPQTYICLWIDCSTSFADPEHLYNHLCNTHIGRKSTNNLCLVCKWKDCGVSCAKRDHITSHLRVHTPLKPHTCEICRKSFKRPQDLKKHEKIHTEEHHAEHKHSKAITVVDSGYLSRVRGEPINPSNRGIKPLTAPNSKYVSTRTKSVSDGSHFGIIPLASSDNHLPVSQQSAYLDDYSSWEGMRSEDTAVSTKRSHGSKVEEFFSDVKKRRVNPAYDGMVERLNSLAYTQQIAAVDQVHGSSFNPRQVSFDIRTPEELAAVNQFLLTLGRDVTGSNQQRQQQMHAPASGHTGADHFSAPNFFDALNLSQMGLAGMPGMPTPDYSSESTYPASGVGPGYHSAVYPQAQSFERTTHSSVQPMHYGSVYPMMATNSNNGSFPSSAADYPTSTRRESFSGYPGHFHHSPSLDTASPISSASTPSSSTPPRAADSIPDSASATFDYLRPSRGQTPVVHLAPSDHALKPMRSIVPLKSLPTLPRPLNTVLPPAPAPEKLEARRTPAKEQDQPRSLYPLLKLGDSKYKLPPLKSSFSAELPDGPQPSSSSSSAAATPVKLPPLHHMYPSPSLIEGDGSMSSRSDKSTPSQLSSPELRRSPLPRLAELGKDSETDPTVEVPPEQRRHHAELILKLLVSINEDFKKRHGAPAFSSPSPRRPSFGQKLLFEDRLQDADVDVDMAVA